MKNSGKTLLALAAVAMTIGYLWHANRIVVPKQVAWEDVVAEAEAGGYRLISTEELAKRYFKEASGMVLVDTRQEWEYRTGHIEGALNFPMAPTWWERWRKADTLKAFLGPDRQRSIVFY